MSIAPKTAQQMAAHWDGRASLFEAAASHNRHRGDWLRVLEKAVGPGPLAVLDLGCGTGACALLLAALGHRVSGLDGSAQMLAQARAAAQAQGLALDLYHADMDSCPLPAGGFDLVCLRNVLWTLENPAAALALAARLLRPGGRVLVSDGLWRRAPDPRLGPMAAHLPHARGLLLADLLPWLQEAGFGPPESWQHLFDGHPYGGVYDDPQSPIPFFLVTAVQGGARAGAGGCD